MKSSNIRRSIWFQQDENGGILINHIYNVLNAAYPIRWKSNFIDQQAIDHWRMTWAAALEKEKVTKQQAFHALAACASKYPWPPSSAEFVALCKSLPLPDYRAIPAPRMTPEQRAAGLRRLREASAVLFK